MRLPCPHCQEQIEVAETGGECPYCSGVIDNPARLISTTLSLPPPERDDGNEETWVGREIASCRIINRLGSGGMGRVYLAHHPGLNKLVAIKVLNRDQVEKSEAVERFIREAQAAARLEHANVVQILHAGRESDHNFIVMQHVEGENLSSLLARQGMLERDEALRIAVEVTRALVAAHDLGIVHRDIKPDNIMFTESGAVKVADFGLARDLTAPSDLTVTGLAYGTPPYMSPEQIAGKVAVDERSDLYSLGVVLFECLAGKRPFDAENFFGYVEQHTKRQAPALGRLVPGLPGELCELVAQLLEKKPEDRYQTARDLLRDLAALAGLNPTTVEKGPGTRRRTRSITGTSRLNEMLSKAVVEGATDLHIEPLSDGWRVRFRLRGSLEPQEQLSPAAGRALVEACRSAAGLVGGEEGEPQDGMIEFPHEELTRQAKLSLMPTRYGPRVALRLLGLVQPHHHLPQFGFLKRDREAMEGWVVAPGGGLVVVSGHAGSGKGNIIGGLLGQIDLSSQLAIAIAEDSFVDSDEVGQVQVSHKLSRAQALTSALRQDPDLVLLLDVHGLPDRDTASAAMRATGDGKLVITSMASETAPDVLEDLLAMGCSPKQLEKGLRGIVCSRLIRRVCPQCQVEYRPGEEVLRQLGAEGDERAGPFYRGRGCSHCQQRGFLGRTTIYDCLSPSADFWLDLGDATREAAIHAVASHHGLVTMPQTALAKALKGHIDPADVPRALPSLYRPNGSGSHPGAG